MDARNRDLLKLIRKSLEQTTSVLQSARAIHDADSISHKDEMVNMISSCIDTFLVTQKALSAAAGESVSLTPSPPSTRIHSIVIKEECDSAPSSSSSSASSSSSNSASIVRSTSASDDQFEIGTTAAFADVDMPLLSSNTPNNLSVVSHDSESYKLVLEKIAQEFNSFIEQCLRAQAAARQKQLARKKAKQQGDEGEMPTKIGISGNTSSSNSLNESVKISKDGTWSCSSCTFSNQAASRRCELCYTYRPAIVVAEARKEKKIEEEKKMSASKKPTSGRASSRRNRSSGPRSGTRGSDDEDSVDDEEEEEEDDEDEEDEDAEDSDSISEVQSNVGRADPNSSSSAKSKKPDKSADSTARVPRNNSSGKLDNPKFTSPANSPRPPLSGSTLNRKRSFEEHSSSGTPGNSGSRLWMGESANLKKEDDDDAEGTMLVWTCTVCTLENSMRARQCDVCGESRAHAIRGHPADGGDGTPRQAPKRVKIQEVSANPRKFPSIGANFQMDLDRLPEAAPWDAAIARRDHEIDGNDDSEYWTSVWIAPRSADGILLEDCAESDLKNSVDINLRAQLCKPRTAFSTSKLHSQKILPVTFNTTTDLDECSNDEHDGLGLGFMDSEREKKATEKIQAVTAMVLSARTDMEKQHNLIDELLAQFPSLESRALETLWKLDYDLENAMMVMQGMSHSSEEDRSAVYRDRPIPELDEEARSKFIEGMGKYGEEWSKVKAYMGHTHSIGNLQDYFYSVICTASHAALRAEANRRYKAAVRTKEKLEKRQKALEEAKARAAEKLLAQANGEVEPAVMNESNEMLSTDTDVTVKCATTISLDLEEKMCETENAMTMSN